MFIILFVLIGFWNGHPVKKDQIKLPSFFNSDFESQMNQAMGGFILVFGLDGDVIYASEGITTQLGISQVYTATNNDFYLIRKSVF